MYIHIYIYTHIQDVMEYVQRYDAGLSPKNGGYPFEHAKILPTMRFLRKSTWLKDAS
jgi:hypothetical protein